MVARYHRVLAADIKSLHISALVSLETGLKVLLVDGIWGADAKCNSYDFLQVISKYSWTTFKTIFETLSTLGVCHVTIIVGVVYKKSMIFEVFDISL